MNCYLVEARLPPRIVARALKNGGDVLGAGLTAAVDACGGKIDQLFLSGGDLRLIAVILLPSSPAAVELLVVLSASTSIRAPAVARLTPVPHTGGTDEAAAPVFAVRAAPRLGGGPDPYGIVVAAITECRGRLIGLYQVGSGSELLALAALPDAAAVAARLRASPAFAAMRVGRMLTCDDVAVALAAAGRHRESGATPPLPDGSDTPRASPEPGSRPSPALPKPLGSDHVRPIA